MAGISQVLQRIFDYIGIDLFGSVVLFGIFLVFILMILLFQMGASRFVLLAFVTPLLLILTLNAGWISQTWIAGLAVIFSAVLFYIILKRWFGD